MRDIVDTIIPFDVETLTKIVNYHFECDINSRCRERRFVNGRMVFSHMLRQRGYTCSAIGRYMNRDHATVLHYAKNLTWYLKTDVVFQRKFDNVMDEFLNNYNPVYDMNKEDLKKEVFSCKSEIKSLHLELSCLKKEQRENNKVLNRVEDLYNMVVERTRKGTEKEVLIKLNHFYNGLYH
jgi:hypothetical protein